MSNKIIKINRGDSYEFDVKITQKDTNEPYILEDGKDIVYFAIMLPHQSFDSAYQKAYPLEAKGYIPEDGDQDISTGNIKIKIEPKDTLRLAPGVYYYTVKLFKMYTNESRINVIASYDKILEARTIIERTKFIINE